MKKQEKNCYAIYYIGTGETVIVKTWAECQEKTKGRSNMFKGFADVGEAREWLAEIDQKKSSGTKQSAKLESAKKAGTGKVPFHLKLSPKAMNDLIKEAETLKMAPEYLVENLILEYLYDR